MTARRPVGLPAHAILVHVPAGLWAAAVVFEALAVLGAAGPWWALAWWNLVVGLVAALPAIATGFWELGRLGARHPALGTAAAHMMAAGTAAALFGVGVLLRGGPAAPEPGLFWVVVVLDAAGALCLAAAVWLGTALVYRHGAGRRRR